MSSTSFRIIEDDNLAALRALPDASVELIYVDPPFNTGVTQQRTRIRTVRDAEGDRTGFGGQRYRTERLASAPTYADLFDDYIGFLRPRMIEAHRILTPTGSLFLHIDPREVHYCKVMLDEVFALSGGAGRACFQNEIIWAYDYGARATKRWPAKHDNILWYTRDPEPLHLQSRRLRPHPLHGARPRRSREGRARQDSHRRLVAHHRAHQRQRKDRLSYPKASRHSAAHRPRPLQSRRHRPRLLRRLRHHRRSRCCATAATPSSSTRIPKPANLIRQRLCRTSNLQRPPKRSGPDNSPGRPCIPSSRPRAPTLPASQRSGFPIRSPGHSPLPPSSFQTSHSKYRGSPSSYTDVTFCA